MKLMMILFALFSYASLPNVAVDESAPGGAYLVIDGKFGGDITHSEIAENTTLGIEGCAAGARIYKFTLVVERDGKSYDFAGKSNVLSKTMLAELNKLEEGDTFTFEKIKAVLGKDDDITVMARTFTIV